MMTTHQSTAHTKPCFWQFARSKRQRQIGRARQNSERAIPILAEAAELMLASELLRMYRADASDEEMLSWLHEVGAPLIDKWGKDVLRRVFNVSLNGGDVH